MSLLVPFFFKFQLFVEEIWLKEHKFCVFYYNFLSVVIPIRTYGPLHRLSTPAVYPADFRLLPPQLQYYKFPLFLTVPHGLVACSSVSCLSVRAW